MIILFTGLALLFLACTLLPLIKTTLRWIRFMDYPRLHFASLALFTLAIDIVWINQFDTSFYVRAGILVLTIALQMQHILPFSFIYKKEVLLATSNKDVFTLMISNVRMDNKKTDKYVEIIQTHKPDLILVNEPDQYWLKQISVIEKDYPFQVKVPLSNTYGMAFYSKLKLIDPIVRFLYSTETPSISVDVELESGMKFHFFGVHPEPPTLHNDTDERDIELIMLAKEASKLKHACLVAGDLNDVAWSYTTMLFKKISGLLDPRVGRGFFNTYNAKIPMFRYPLDHIFFSRSFRLIEMKRLEFFGSDHFPIFLKLSLEPEKKHEHDKPTPEKKDLEYAQEILKESGVGSQKAQKQK